MKTARSSGDRDAAIEELTEGNGEIGGKPPEAGPTNQLLDLITKKTRGSGGKGKPLSTTSLHHVRGRESYTPLGGLYPEQCTRIETVASRGRVEAGEGRRRRAM